MALDYGEVLGKAWRIIWKHKILWIFGIFAGCGRGGGGGGGGGSGWEQNQPFGSGSAPEVERALSQFGQWITDNLWVVVMTVLVILVLVVVSIFLGTIGRIGLIRGTLKADEGAEKLRFSELFKESMPFFWRVFLLTFLLGLALLIIILPLVLFGVLTAGVGFLCFLPLICILIPLAWILGILIEQANAAMVIENLGIVDGVRRGWEVVRKNIGPVLLIWLITAIIGFVIGLVLVIPLLISIIPAFVALASSNGEVNATVIAAGLCFVVYLPVLVAAGGMLTAYLQTVWALTFLRLTRPQGAISASPVLPANA